MNKSQTEKIITLLKGHGLEPMAQKPHLWLKGVPPNTRMVDMSVSPPQVCVFDGHNRLEEGHGIQDLDIIKEQIGNILKTKDEGKTDVSKSQKAAKKGSKNEEDETKGEIVTKGAVVEVVAEPIVEAEVVETKPVVSNKEITEIEDKHDKAPTNFPEEIIETNPSQVVESKPVKKHLCSECGVEITPEQASESYERHDLLMCLKCENPVKAAEANKQVGKGRPVADALIPVKAITPSGTMIKGLAPQMKEIGKIKIGRKGTNTTGSGFRLPEKFDHFEIVSLIRDENTNDLIPDKAVMDVIGEGCKELDVMLLYNDATLNFMTRYNEYKGGKCQCSGDGEKATTIEGNVRDCNPDVCPKFLSKVCKPNGILSVVLMSAPRLGGVYKFRTTSFNSIRSILSSLFFIQSITGGTLAGIPLKMTVTPQQVSPTGVAKMQTIYVVNLEYPGTIEDLLNRTIESTKLQAGMRSQIQELEATARMALCEPEETTEIEDVEAEFYPVKE